MAIRGYPCLFVAIFRKIAVNSRVAIFVAIYATEHADFFQASWQGAQKIAAWLFLLEASIPMQRGANCVAIFCVAIFC